MSVLNVTVATENNSNLLQTLLEKKRTTKPIELASLGELWRSECYGLEKSSLYRTFNEDQRNTCLNELSRQRLEEAYHIERSGMAYTAKMTLMSKSLEERELYSHFSEDEARHLSYLTRVIPNVSENHRDNPFLCLLEQVIQDGERRPLIFIIQILLEGWGIEHYTEMASSCQNEEFRLLLQQIIRDEAGHHGSGLILFSENELTSRERNYIIDILAQFFHMIQLGPVSILESVEKASGGLLRHQKVELYQQLEAEKETMEKINILKRLMHRSSSNGLMSSMEDRGYLRAYTCDEAITFVS
jgi:rubrerythrin